MNEFPKLHSPNKLACVSFSPCPSFPILNAMQIDRKSSIRITLHPGIPSGQSSRRVSFPLGCTPWLCVLRDVVRFFYLTDLHCKYHSFVTQPLLALLCRSRKFHACQCPLPHKFISSLLTILILKHIAVPNTRRGHGSRARFDLFAYRHRVHAPLQETEGVHYGDRTQRSFSRCNRISTR